VDDAFAVSFYDAAIKHGVTAVFYDQGLMRAYLQSPQGVAYQAVGGLELAEGTGRRIAKHLKSIGG